MLNTPSATETVLTPDAAGICNLSLCQAVRLAVGDEAICDCTTCVRHNLDGHMYGTNQ